MATSKTSTPKLESIAMNDLSQKEQDILSLDTKAAMKKYKMNKQAVYDKRYALKKRLAVRAAAPSVTKDAETKPAKRGPKKGSKRIAKQASAPFIQPDLTENLPVAETPASRDLMVMSKQLPVIHKPIEINFDNFTVRLNGMPKKISVNPETNAIEIDL